MEGMITVLRLGHRLPRDQRISTHLGLVARQFGADEIIFSGEYDKSLLESLDRIQEKWGKVMEVRYEKNWKGVVQEYRNRGFTVVHLTMYGIDFEEKVDSLRGKDLLVVVGSEKVPAEMYELADYNLSVGSQPHSEVSALALFLDRVADWRAREFKGKIRVVPQERGKKVEKVE